MGIFSNKRIYADWAATTPLHPRVEKVMAGARKTWANPSAIHAEGVEAMRALEASRAKVAKLVGVKPEEVYFTSGGTEANATIIQGVLRTKLEKTVKPGDIHIVTTAIEHSSVLEAVKLTIVNPGPDGIVRAEDVLAAITPETALVTVMLANNEIGTIQQVSKIGAGIRKMRTEKLSDFPVFHTDASQAPLWMSVDIEGLRADAMTLDAHKMQGPKGIGALIVRRHVNWEPLMVGGGQEQGKRPTTESVELVAGFAEALTIAQENGNGEREARVKAALSNFDYFLTKIRQEFPRAIVNGSTEKGRRLPNNMNISLPDISDPELAVLFLDKEGVACSTKSSCLKGEDDSYVVKSLGGDAWRARNTLRFSLAPDATPADVDTIVRALKKLP